MSASISRLAARQSTDWYNNGHLSLLAEDLQAMAEVANLTSANTSQAVAAAAAAASSYSLMAALGASAYGVGNEPLDLTRAVFLNSEGFRQWDMAVALYPNTQNATYQITEHDATKLLLCTSGTRTWTLPVATDVWIGWRCWLRNRSGNNLTLNTGSASDAINGGSAGSGITVATGSAILTVVCTGAAAFEVA